MYVFRYICMFLGIYIYIYTHLFIGLHQVLAVAHGTFVASCGIFHCGSWTLAPAGGLSSCGEQA